MASFLTVCHFVRSPSWMPWEKASPLSLRISAVWIDRSRFRQAEFRVAKLERAFDPLEHWA